MTPFHNMSLMCPATAESDVARHHEAIDACFGELL
jgi:glutamate-1-semialdehyde 2,1-aminomutase